MHSFADDLHYDVLVDHLASAAIVRAEDCMLVGDYVCLKGVSVVRGWGCSG